MMRASPISAALLLGACSTSQSPPPAGADQASADPAGEHYEARGQEPGWHLVIHGGRIDYTGNYGDKKVSVARPDPRPSFNGRRYETARLTVDVTYSRCNDVMSGFGFEHQVSVVADGESFKGCGGARKSEWDQ